MSSTDHEITIRLQPGQATLIFSPRDIINTIIAEVDIGYYAGEDVQGGWPYKIILRPSLQTLFEVAFNEEHIRFIMKHFARMLKTRYQIAHGVSDQNSA